MTPSEIAAKIFAYNYAHSIADDCMQNVLNTLEGFKKRNEKVIRNDGFLIVKALKACNESCSKSIFELNKRPNIQFVNVFHRHGIIYLGVKTFCEGHDLITYYNYQRFALAHVEDSKIKELIKCKPKHTPISHKEVEEMSKKEKELKTELFTIQNKLDNIFKSI